MLIQLSFSDSYFNIESKAVFQFWKNPFSLFMRHKFWTALHRVALLYSFTKSIVKGGYLIRQENKVAFQLFTVLYRSKIATYIQRRVNSFIVYFLTFSQQIAHRKKYT